MVLELLGMQDGRVDLSLVQDIRAELKEVTLTPSTNPFFQADHLATFGDLGTPLKPYVQPYLPPPREQPAVNQLHEAVCGRV
ncbi:hypothetical protein FOMPIDRAFT_1052773 [Fomitopsis schrenkii]|uniref:Uncharacterized protein n=1 Tax=Fomitopsis schrenkii TaxID=2126942 RepID=S8FFB0_FOMSC|nr:hypothetical protein FOMPIDRAFT_1052773 [Fomitopsis schrenkii]